jgi:GH24 family phage-related lysozyme (muramidase)
MTEQVYQNPWYNDNEHLKPLQEYRAINESIEHIKQFEGFRSTVYKDPGNGREDIGYGFQNTGLKSITKEEADRMLSNFVRNQRETYKSAIPEGASEWTRIVADDLFYRTGYGKIRNSEIAKAIGRDDQDKIASILPQYNKAFNQATGKYEVLPGLVSRNNNLLQIKDRLDREKAEKEERIEIVKKDNSGVEEFKKTATIVESFLTEKLGKDKMTVTSGHRTIADHLRIYAEKGITDKDKIPMGSKHLTGQAIDVSDADGSIGEFLAKNPHLLEEAGLYIEDPKETPGWVHFQTVKPTLGKAIFKPFPTSPSEAKGKLGAAAQTGTLGTAINEEIKKGEGNSDPMISSMIKPFRTYHLVTSFSDIIKNDIGISTKEMNNSVQVSYPDSFGKSNWDGSHGYSGYNLTQKIKADDDIDPRYIKNKIYTFHNAHKSETDDLPQRYAKSLLVKNIEKGYDGKLVILGRAGIKPHDVIFLYDIYSDMIGPVGVRRVVQIFDTNRGWITEITPKMMAFPDNSIGAAQLNVLKKIASGMALGATEMFYTDMERYCPDDYSAGVNAKVAETRGVMRALANEARTKEERAGTASTGDDGTVTSGDYASALGEKAVEAGVMAASATIGKAMVANASFVSDIRSYAKEWGAVQKSISDARMARNSILPKGAMGAIAGDVASVTAKSALNAGTTAAKLAGKVALRFAGPLSFILIEAGIEGIINWTKYRQPLLFHPLTRKGVPWYGGLRGFKDNTIIESVGARLEEWGNRAEYVRELFARHISRLQEK